MDYFSKSQIRSISALVDALYPPDLDLRLSEQPLFIERLAEGNGVPVLSVLGFLSTLL